MPDETETRLMGLDVGDVRIGVALSDPLRITAQPFLVVKRSSTEKAISRIAEIVREKSVEKIVVGIPLARDGTHGPMARRILEFVAELRREISIPVISWDERYSTHQANRALLEGNVRRRKRKETVDKTAAALILQSFLDAEGSSGMNPEDRDYLDWAMESDEGE
jgi:putative Holliday junction resolvase